eukprot:m.106138 g.106138  ORF g.106138 m.106138 type:complete len:418 (-) comp12669_c0_seq1:2194-3447(-)
MRRVALVYITLALAGIWTPSSSRAQNLLHDNTTQNNMGPTCANSSSFTSSLYDNKQPYSSTCNHNTEYVWVSVFDTIQKDERNTKCELGALGETMASVPLKVSGQCIGSLVLGVIGLNNSRSYYELEQLSHDGEFLSYKVGCDENCNNCLFEGKTIQVGACVSNDGQSMVVQANDGCTGPLNLKEGDSDTIVVKEVIAAEFDCHGIPAIDEWLIFAFALDEFDTECKEVSLFRYFNFTIQLSKTKDDFSMQWCNTSSCPVMGDTICEPLFKSVSLGSCQAISWLNHPGILQVLPVSTLEGCGVKDNATTYVAITGGAVAFIALVVIALLFMRKRPNTQQQRQQHPENNNRLIEQRHSNTVDDDVFTLVDRSDHTTASNNNDIVSDSGNPSEIYVDENSTLLQFTDVHITRSGTFESS